MESSLVVLFIFFLAPIYTSALEAGADSDPSSEPSACAEIPVVENAEVSPTSLKSKYTAGDSLAYQCQQGYVGRVSFNCDGKKWNNPRDTKCSRKRCQLPQDIPNGHFQLINGTEFVYESVIKYTCKTGYHMVSLTDTRTCLAQGWSNHLPECEETICPPPVAKDNLVVAGLSDYDDSLPKYGHLLKFTCESVNFQLVGPNEITCGENGKWSHPFPKCEEIICELEEIREVSVFGIPPNNAPIKYGHKLFFHCTQPGTVLSGSHEVICSAEGKWSSSFPTCEEILCKEEELKNVKISYGVPGISPPYKPKHSLTFQCVNHQWKMTGSRSITCREDGQWSSSFPVCSEIRGCGPPPLVQFADLTTLQKPFYNSGARVEYRCQQFYTRDGDAFKTCVQGMWTGQMRCLKPCVVTIEDMNAHKIILIRGPQRVMYAEHADHITFVCQRGKYPTQYYLSFRKQCIDGVMHLPSCQ